MGEIEYLDTGTDDGAAAVADADGDGTDGAGDAGEDGHGEDGAGDAKDEGLPEDAPEWAVKRIGKLTAKRKAAEEARDAAVAEAETLRKSFSDADALRAAKRAGAMPGLFTADEIKTVDRADALAAAVRRLEAMADDAEEIEGEDGETVRGVKLADGRVIPLRSIKARLRDAREDLAEVADDAAALRKAKGAELRDLLAIGRAAKAAGWKPGVTPVKSGKPKARVDVPDKDAPPKRGGKMRLEDVKTEADVLKLLEDV